MRTTATVPLWALQSVAGDVSAIAVLVGLCAYRNRDGEAWPSVPTIARLVGLKERAVRGALRRLEATGAIVATNAPAGATRTYRIDAEPLHDGAAPHPGLTVPPPRHDDAAPPAPPCRGPRHHGAAEVSTTSPSEYQEVKQAAAPAASDGPLADRFTDPEHRDSYAGIRRAAHRPDKFDAALESLHLGTTSGQPLTWWQLGQGMTELLAANAQPTPAAIRGFAKNCPPAPVQPPADADPSLTPADLQRCRDLLALADRNRLRLEHGDPPEPEPAWADTLRTRHAAWFARQERAA
jgi:hypothetical protein